MGYNIASSIMIHSLMTMPDYATMWIGFVVCQVSLTIFNFVFQAVTKYDDNEQLLNDNAAVGINHAANLISAGLLLSRALTLSPSLARMLKHTGGSCLFSNQFCVF